MAIFYFMAFEDTKEVPYTANSSYDEFDNCVDNDESSILSKLGLKCQNILSKKKFYKRELFKLTKDFEDFKKSMFKN